MAARKSISDSLRYKILRRDRSTCVYCGATAREKALHVDHITPVAKGGTNDFDNLVTACIDCNSGKSDDGAVISRAEHAAVLRAKDAEIARLRGLLAKAGADVPARRLRLVDPVKERPPPPMAEHPERQKQELCSSEENAALAREYSARLKNGDLGRQFLQNLTRSRRSA